MIRLTREIRFSLVDDDSDRPTNSWAGWPAAIQVAPYLILRCTLAGELNPDTGYLCDIKAVDAAVRQRVVKPLCQFPPPSAESIVAMAFGELQRTFADELSVAQVALLVTPYLHYSISARDEAMIRLTQQFEFSASHRLHLDHLSEQQNRDLFGKCNNPHGHGHNYVIDVTVAEPVESQAQPACNLTELESVVKREVIDPFDHKYLNCEVDAFRNLNPTVENIAIVIWDRLQDKLAPAKLQRIRVYETPKTWADYSGD